jgi:choline dehydrogenase-like flavoprotein
LFEEGRLDYDVLIVGAGSSGCVLAARLSEDPSRRVLLVEAGPFYPELADYPAELAYATSYAAAFPGHPNNWSFVSTLTPDRLYPMPRGFAVGGSSAVNGSYFIRGRPLDFDGWAALGNLEWSWERVLPYFIRCEDDRDFAGPLHGKGGPVPVKRLPLEKYHPVSAAFSASCASLGFADDADKNDPSTLGVGSCPRNCIDGVRMNMALVYLGPALSRPNLTLMADTRVRRVLIENGRATGVEAERNGETVKLSAREVVLCAGGIKSPHLLMLSGVGDATELAQHGIAVAHHSPGVGKGVMDHPTAALLFRTRELNVELAPGAVSLQAYLNATCPGSDLQDDIQISCASVALATMLKRPKGAGGRSWLPSYLAHPIQSLRAMMKLGFGFAVRQGLSQHDLQLTCALHQQKSVGRISLASADPDTQPAIDLDFFSHPDDMPRMRAMVRLAAQIVEQPAFRAIGARRVAPSDDELADDAALERWIRSNVANTFHTTSAARMGPDGDPGAVVDQYCRVRGVEGLRVVDISIAPKVTRRGTAATAVMIGERAAAFFDAPRAG